MLATLERAFGCLAMGLAFLHEKKVRHKDIKPRNILVHRGTVIYTDFGSSFDSAGLTHSATEGRPTFLTRRYSAPEVLEHEKRTSKSDVYSLGCVLIGIFSALTLQLEVESNECFSHIMDSLHDKLLQATFSSRMAFLPALITGMTMRDEHNRFCSVHTAAAFGGQSDFFCTECASASSSSRIERTIDNQFPALKVEQDKTFSGPNDEPSVTPENVNAAQSPIGTTETSIDTGSKVMNHKKMEETSWLVSFFAAPFATFRAFLVFISSLFKRSRGTSSTAQEDEKYERDIDDGIEISDISADIGDPTRIFEQLVSDNTQNVNAKLALSQDEDRISIDQELSQEDEELLEHDSRQESEQHEQGLQRREREWHKELERTQKRERQRQDEFERGQQRVREWQQFYDKWYIQQQERDMAQQRERKRQNALEREQRRARNWQQYYDNWHMIQQERERQRERDKQQERERQQRYEQQMESEQQQKYERQMENKRQQESLWRREQMAESHPQEQQYSDEQQYPRAQENREEQQYFAERQERAQQIQ